MIEKPNSAIGVFLSYSHENRFIAETLAAQLREVGYHPWVDFDALTGGDEWKKMIENALTQSAALLILLTPESIQSDWVMYEFSRAKEIGCPIIPVLVQTCEIPAAIQVYQFIDFRQGMNPALNKLQQALLKAITTGMEPKPSAAPQPPEVKSSQTTFHQPVDDRPLALVIEDMADYQNKLHDMLTEIGFAVHIAGTSNEAMDLIRENKYAFITLDMQLGPDDQHGQGGVFLLTRLERYQEGVPVVMITSVEYDKVDTSEFFMDYRIKGMLDKPINESKLRELIRKHVKEIAG